jgi:hypothetical protein
VDFNWQGQALLTLQEAADAFIVHLFEEAYLLSLHAGRVTLFPKDVQLSRRIQGIQEGFGWAPGAAPLDNTWASLEPWLNPLLTGMLPEPHCVCIEQCVPYLCIFSMEEKTAWLSSVTEVL